MTEVPEWCVLAQRVVYGRGKPSWRYTSVFYCWVLLFHQMTKLKVIMCWSLSSNGVPFSAFKSVERRFYCTTKLYVCVCEYGCVCGFVSSCMYVCEGLGSIHQQVKAYWWMLLFSYARTSFPRKISSVVLDTGFRRRFSIRYPLLTRKVRYGNQVPLVKQTNMAPGYQDI